MLTILDVVRIVGDLGKKMSVFKDVFVSRLEDADDIEAVLEQISSYSGLKMREQLALAYKAVLLHLFGKLGLGFKEEEGEICSKRTKRCVTCAILYPWNRRVFLGKKDGATLTISSRRVTRKVSKDRKFITWKGLVFALRLIRYGVDEVLVHSILLENELDRTLDLLAQMVWNLESGRVPWTVEAARETIERVKSWKTLELLRFLAEHEGPTLEEIRQNMEERLGERLPQKALGSLIGVLSRLSRGHEPIVKREGERYVLDPAFKAAVHEVHRAGKRP